MKVWLVGNRDRESTNVRHICVSKSTALKRWEEIRQELIGVNNKILELCKKDGGDTEMSERILLNLSEPNPDLMDNYPQDQPFIEERETE